MALNSCNVLDITATTHRRRHSTADTAHLTL